MSLVRSPIGRRMATLVLSLGVDPRRMAAGLSSFFPFVKSFYFARRVQEAGWPVHFSPSLGDGGESAGSARGHYFHMDLWAARHVYAGQFEKLVDVGSRVDGYIAHLLVFREVEVFDVRPLISAIDGLSFQQANLVEYAGLPEEYADCVSCLHALEHFGLGRYGDPIDMKGWEKGLAGLARLLKRDGTLLLAVPIGQQRIEFDAHRVFSPSTIIDAAAKNCLTLEQFAMVDDQGEYWSDKSIAEGNELTYGCGCFKFKKQSRV
jgi:SAM-dependent methyltransferase